MLVSWVRVCSINLACLTTHSDIDVFDFRRRRRGAAVLFLHTLSSSYQSTLSGSFIHPPDRPPPTPPLPEKSSLHNKPGIFQMIPPGTFPVASAGASLTLFLFAQQHQSNPEQAGMQVGQGLLFCGLLSPQATTRYLSQPRWVTRWNQNMKKEGL